MLDVTKLYPHLNAPTVGDLQFWTNAFLQAKAAGHLGLVAETGVFQDVLGSVDSSTLQTLSVVADGVALRALTRRDADALAYSDSPVATHFIAGTGVIQYWPVNPAGAAIWQWRVFTTNSNVPEIAFDLVLFRTLADARMAETDGAMPEVSAVVMQVVGLVESVLKERFT